MARGSIRKREGRPKPWEVRVDLGADPATGQRRQRSHSFLTRREAQTALTRWLAEVDAGSVVDRSPRTVGAVLQEWLETEARPRVTPRTWEGYELTIRVHLLPTLGTIPLQKLTPPLLQRFFAARRAAGCGDKTVRNCYQRLHQALDYATRLGYVRTDATQKVTPPPLKHPKRSTWTAEQVRAYLAHAAGSSHGPIFVLALATGLREGELLGLRWGDVDLDARLLHVRQAAKPLRRRLHGQRVVLGEPKSPAARRTISLPAHAVAALREHRREQQLRRLQVGPLWSDHDLVFSTGLGGIIHPNNIGSEHRRWVERAGVPRITVHDLRHTFATLALAAGMPVHAVSEMLGHANIATTLQVYAHVIREQHEQIADTMDALLFAPSSVSQM